MFAAQRAAKTKPSGSPRISRNSLAGGEAGPVGDRRSSKTGGIDAKIVEYRKAFSFFDANRDGHITVEELESAMKKCGIHLTKLETKMIMIDGDKDSEWLLFPIVGSIGPNPRLIRPS